MQNGPITDSLPRGWIRSVEQGLHFLLDQIRHQPSVGFLEGDRQNAAHLPNCGWLTVLQKPEERPDGSQRTFRVSAELPRVVSRCSRNVQTSAASNCSSIRSEGATLSFFEANSNRHWKLMLPCAVRAKSWSPSLHKVLRDDGDVEQKLGCGLQVPVGSVDVDVAEVGSQGQHVLPDSLAASWRRLQCPDCQRVPKLMNPWPSAA